MSIQRSRSPFERLRQRLDRTSARCRECGYDGDDAGWHVTTSGRSIHYRFVCPSCAASRRGRSGSRHRAGEFCAHEEVTCDGRREGRVTGDTNNVGNRRTESDGARGDTHL
ncbi:HVO_0649 family zinc finger protein [Saliphagus sp. GCM10025317]